MVALLVVYAQTDSYREIMTMDHEPRKPNHSSPGTVVAPIKIGMLGNQPVIVIENQPHPFKLELGFNKFWVEKGDGYAAQRCGIWLCSERREAESILTLLEQASSI
jgi:hypothetical protein